MKEKTGKIIRSIFLTATILVMTGLFISRCGFVMVPVTTPYAYRPILKYRWETPDLVTHFPDKIPDQATEVKFYYRAGFMQGGTTIELRMKLPKAEFNEIIQKHRPDAKLVLDHLGRDIDPDTSGKVYFAPPLHFYTISRNELTNESQTGPLPAGYEIFLIHIKKHKRYWNHGKTSGIAFCRSKNEVLYRAEVW